MKTVTAAIVLFAVLASGTAWADKQVEDYSATINTFKENETVAPFFGSAYGYAMFPTIGKGGIGIGAAHGTGQVYRGGKVTGFTSMTKVTIGFQLGGQAYSQLVFFESKQAYDDFTTGNFEFAAQASAIAITAGAHAGTSTEGGSGASTGTGDAGTQVTAGYENGMLVFVIGKGGLMYEASIGGGKYSFDPVS